jgi:hypothetical protein
MILIVTTLFRHQKEEPAGCFIIRSFDRGLTFSVPKSMPLFGYDWIAASGSIVELSNGNLMLSVSASKAGQSTSVLALVSEDRGENWNTYHVITENHDQDVHFRNPVLAQTSDQNILCMMEVNQEEGILTVSHSSDGGQNWSPIQRSGIYGWNHDLVLSAEGTLLCTYVDESPEGISCSRSYDHGVSWEQEMRLADCLLDKTNPSIFLIRKDRAAVCYTEYRDNEWVIQASVFSVHTPSKPRGLSASLRGKKEIRIRWNQVKGAAYYIVYRSTESDFVPKYGKSGNVVAMVISPKFVDVKVDSGATYYYCISAVSGRGKLIPNTGNEGETSELLAVKVK